MSTFVLWVLRERFSRERWEELTDVAARLCKSQDPALVRDPKRFAEIYSEQFNALAKEVGL